MGPIESGEAHQIQFLALDHRGIIQIEVFIQLGQMGLVGAVDLKRWHPYGHQVAVLIAVALECNLHFVTLSPYSQQFRQEDLRFRREDGVHGRNQTTT